jgi:hypothetical protein
MNEEIKAARKRLRATARAAGMSFEELCEQAKRMLARSAAETCKRRKVA